MFDFLVRRSSVKGAQKLIDQQLTSVSIHIPPEIPLPSLGVLKKMIPVAAQINALEKEMSELTDAQLKAKTGAFRSRYQESISKEREACRLAREAHLSAQGPEEKEDTNIKLEEAELNLTKTKKKILDSILPEAFAVVREAGKRVLKMRHYDVQMIGGMVLNNGSIAEMTTGEGKTLVATLPAYLNALTGEGVHVVTVNDYLAGRDRDWMAPLFEFLGLSVGVIQHDMMPIQRKAAYSCDITYGTNNEFGFDYLRDNMVIDVEDMVQRKHYFCIVDEVDSILVDEARTPLIISGPSEQATDKYYKAFEICKKLKGRRITEKDEIAAKHSEEGLDGLTKGYDYLADEKAKSISLTDDGEEKAAQMFGIDNLHEMNTIEYRHHILQALRAKEFFKIDVDYVIRDGQVVIVDEFTGRLMPGRRWSDGLHQAVEAREGIKIERENQTLATITFQNYFRMYEKLSGMTGTAETEATEFKQIYNLDCVVIPTNKPLQRLNYADAIYRSLREKFNAVVDEIEECNKKGQPVLVGTISIEKSEMLSQLLKSRGIKHQVLNAKNHDREALIIAQAGRLAAVTIATNMAGRGTDIVLGGNPEFLAKSLVNDKMDERADEAQKQQAIEEFIQKFYQQCKEEQAKVISLGGLHVIGTERHESRRIDNQLRGRQGRQGDPGSSRFYVSLEDDLMRLFASDRIIGMMDKLGMEEGQALEHPWLTKALENAQKRVEGHNFEIRKHLLEYDNVMNRQREVIYEMRRHILESGDVKEMILEAVNDVVAEVVQQYLFTLKEGGEETAWDFDGLAAYFKSMFNHDITPYRELFQPMPQDEIAAFIIKGLDGIYKEKERDIFPDKLRFLERIVYLNTIDGKWKDHLYGMDQLKEGIGLRSFGQRDPLIEYKKEGFHMFQAMYGSIHQEVAEIIFKVQPTERPQKEIKGVFSSLPQNFIHKETQGFSSPQSPADIGMSRPSSAENSQKSPQKPLPVHHDEPKVGRNDPCPCGSGKKYKKCCGQ